MKYIKSNQYCIPIQQSRVFPSGAGLGREAAPLAKFWAFPAPLNYFPAPLKFVNIKLCAVVFPTSSDTYSSVQTKISNLLYDQIFSTSMEFNTASICPPIIISWFFVHLSVSPSITHFSQNLNVGIWKKGNSLIGSQHFF